MFITLYFAIGMAFTICRLYMIIKEKIGLTHRKWKVFYLTAICLETIIIWPIDLLITIILILAIYCSFELGDNRFSMLVDDVIYRMTEED